MIESLQFIMTIWVIFRLYDVIIYPDREEYTFIRKGNSLIRL